MSFDFNQEDIELLYNEPHQLIINYQKSIEAIILSFVRAKQFRFEELSEVKQQINEELLNRIPKIQDQFQGKALLRTYLTVIIRNICNEILRKKSKIKKVDLDEVAIPGTHSETLHLILIEEEMARFKKALALFYKQKYKLILCLKLRFKVPFDYEDFININRDITQIEFKNFVQKVYPYGNTPDVKVFTLLTEILNKYENKNNEPDSLRKWIALKINELIEILNGKPPLSHHTEETLQILFEKCFCNQEEMIS